MELYKEILAKVIQEEKVEIIFPDLQLTAAEIVELKSYEALETIKAIIQDDKLSDFMCVEKIVYLLETLGSEGGFRHDF